MKLGAQQLAGGVSVALALLLTACGGSHSSDSETYANPPAMPKAELDEIINRANKGDPDAYWSLFSYNTVMSEQAEADKWLAACVQHNFPQCLFHVASIKATAASILNDNDPRKLQLLRDARSQIQAALGNRALDADFDVGIAEQAATDMDRRIKRLVALR